MDPDVAHPPHQSNQTVRNRGEGGGRVAGVRGGGGGGGGGSLSPDCRAAFFLRWPGTNPSPEPPPPSPPSSKNMSPVTMQ